MDISVQPVELNSVAAPQVWVPQRQGWLANWHLLSLDAPCVATCWTWFVARSAHVAIAPLVLVAMFLAVWLVYAADRLLDGRSQDARLLEPRHLFHRRHRGAFRFVILIGSAALIPLVVAMPAPILRLYFGLAAMFVAWFALVHLAARTKAHKLPKELMPGAFCAAAAFIPVWAEIGFRHGELAIAATAFAALVTLNCWLIFSWENDDLTQANSTTRLGVRWIRQVGAAMIVLPLLTIRLGGRELAPFFVAISLAAALLMALDLVSQWLQPTDLRAASDFVLLTPLLVALFLR